MRQHITTLRQRRSDHFVATVADRDVVVVTHDNPDPDAVAAGWALTELLHRAQSTTARLVGRGAIVRAENAHMMRLLNPPLELVDELPTNGAAIVLVDCSPTSTNHLLSGGVLKPVAVIDHHKHLGRRFHVKHRDIRPRAAATAGIAAHYLREQNVEPGRDLATALLYAIRTETMGHKVHLTRTDRGSITWLSRFADHEKLAEIENAPLAREYFSDLLLALENTFLHQDTAICLLPQASGAEIVGEVADMLIRCEGIAKVLCLAAVRGEFICSARTTEHGGDAVSLLGKTLQGLGNSGGHTHRAGGKTSGVVENGKGREALFSMLKERWLSVCDVNHQRGIRLVERKVILDHL